MAEVSTRRNKAGMTVRPASVRHPDGEARAIAAPPRRRGTVEDLRSDRPDRLFGRLDAGGPHVGPPGDRADQEGKQCNLHATSSIGVAVRTLSPPPRQ